MNKQILYLLVLLLAIYVSADYGCPGNEQACYDYCNTHIIVSKGSNTGKKATGGEYSGLFRGTCQCTYD